MNLREAAQQATPREQLMKELMDSRVPKTEREHAAALEIERLRAALADDAMQRFTNEQQMIERGTKAWAGVPDATAWVEEMRGNVPAPTCQESRQVEPVAWLHEWDGTALLNTVPPDYYGDHWKHTPLYTAPPQRTPLTDEDIDALRQGEQRLNFVTLREFRVIARAIERAHGIGGEK